MKKKVLLTIIIVCMVGLFASFLGCSSFQKEESDSVPNAPKVVKVNNSGFTNVEGYLEYVEIDGHIYLMYVTGYRGGITHSGTCPCNNSNTVGEK